MSKFKTALLIILIPLLGISQNRGKNQDSIVAGFRASRILSSYPNNQFPSPEYWLSVGDGMAAKFNNASPAGIWIVSLYMDDGYTKLNFPSACGSCDYIWFSEEDQNEEWLTYFDEHGLKVWLQVEPGAADILTLMQLVITRYQDHPCVIGFGVDIEWFQAQDYPEGKPVTDEEAELWETTLKEYNPAYTLFLKHYNKDWMPPEYRGDILFVDDSQDFGWANDPFGLMVNEFGEWAAEFSPNPSAFQFGYPADQSWWSQLNDPPQDIGQALIDNIPECYGIFWVDFTITQIFPVSGYNELQASGIRLYNYPNPFRNRTSFIFELPENVTGHFEIFDIHGNIIKKTTKQTYTKGKHNISFNAINLQQGSYYYKFVSNRYSESNRFIIVK
jgi:hypothetical protein